MDAFYRSLGDGRYESSVATAGPWSPESQHAGPPSGLLGAVLEQHAPREGFRIARVTLEIPRPVPVAELEVRATVRHSTARTELLDGEITAGGRTVMLARAWRVVASPHDTPTLRHGPPPPGVPDDQTAVLEVPGIHTGGYLSAMEWRFADGAAFLDDGPGTAWVRQRIPLIADAEDTPLTRALTLADSNWAVGSELDVVRQLVINTDVTVALHRDPVGEWLCLRSETAASPDGSGLAAGRLDDLAGDCGRVLQTLLVAGR
ncbi:thioesterase family protein [Cryptosporangium aurantiacum]|uniref:Thioesterase-like superfamily protein n=1 Tax=Cryptosporangium aurantiacum TaxID=134849 RepID=A0A1M7RB15_9ACTN|nr:thioesterase family protein [Cryptosporangium aurantiacum]SHN43515.1 Thioesterase-like superfamily protein [Cryptosporangium aurantiacum]